MVNWNTNLREHNHELHAFIAQLNPDPEEFEAACAGFMAGHTSHVLPVCVQRDDFTPLGSPTLTSWQVWMEGVHIGTFDTQAEADAIALERQPSCPDCAAYRARE